MSNYATFGCAWTCQPFSVEIAHNASDHPTHDHHTEKYSHHAVTHQEKLDQAYCPHMPVSNGKYARTTQSHMLRIKGNIYQFKTCCSHCANAVLSDPGKYVVTCKESPSTFCLKHQTGRIVQYLKQV